MKKKIDNDAVRELELYAENTRQVYDACLTPTIAHLQKKYKKGVYDKGKACKAWEHVAEYAAKMYYKEFCENGMEWYNVFPAAERRECAKQLEEIYFDEYIK